MISLEGVSRTFEVGNQPVRALCDVNLTIERGEYLSLMGPSGSGKSTLLNIVGLLDRPTSGRYRFAGDDVTALDDNARAAVRRLRIGFVFQSFHLIPRLSTAQNIALPLVLAEVAPSERHHRVEEQLRAFALLDRAHHLPDQLSGGQRQRAAIARATIMRPDLLLADEPTGNLDRHTGNDVVTALEHLQQDGLTLIVVTHDPDLGRRASRRLQMDDGRIISDGKHDRGPDAAAMETS